MNLGDIVNFLKEFQQKKIYNLFLLNEHTDEEFEDMDDYIQTNDKMIFFLREITNNLLKIDESIKKYYELHYDEPKEYLTVELLMLLYYMSDTNEMDTTNLTKELKDCVNEAINLFKDLIQIKDTTMLHDKIISFNESLSKTLPMACTHMVNVAETFDKSNMYQQMMDNFSKINVNFDKYLDTLLPTDDEKENFLQIINKLTKSNNWDESNNCDELNDNDELHDNNEINKNNKLHDNNETNKNDEYKEITNDIINEAILNNHC